MTARAKKINKKDEPEEIQGADNIHTGKARLSKRVLAKLLDVMIALVLLKIVPGLLGFLAGFGYILFADGLSKGKSLGKGLFGQRVVKFDVTPSGDEIEGAVALEIPSGEKSDDLSEGQQPNTNENTDEVDEHEKASENSNEANDRETSDNVMLGLKLSFLRNTTVGFGLLLYYLFGSQFIAGIIFSFEFLLMLGNSNGQRLGDMFAGTVVIDAD